MLCRKDFDFDFEEKTSEIEKRVGPNKVVYAFFFPSKTIRFAARLFGRSEYYRVWITVVWIIFRRFACL